MKNSQLRRDSEVEDSLSQYLVFSGYLMRFLWGECGASVVVEWESSSLACFGLEGTVLPKERFQLVKEPFLCLQEKWEPKDSSESRQCLQSQHAGGQSALQREPLSKNEAPHSEFRHH